MPQLFLLRHLQSQWNLENRFAGWVDNPLGKEGIESAKTVAQKFANEKIDAIYTSPLIRNEETVTRIFECLGRKYPLFLHFKGKMKNWANFEGNGNYIPTYISENLNERYYGKLQGQNREEVKNKYGEKQFLLWRRSFSERPPGGESLKDTFKRTMPFYKKYIERDLKEGKNVLVVASHNSLRAIVKYIENISDEDIINFEIPYAGLIKYEFDENLKYSKQVAKLLK